MIEGVWVVRFATANQHGAGVVVFETGRVFGGDSSFYMSGTYTVDKTTVTARVRVRKHTNVPSMFSVLGSDDTVIDVVGQLSGDTMGGHGRRVDQPSMVVNLNFERLDDLP
jgi:hypothetical protein